MYLCVRGAENADFLLCDCDGAWGILSFRAPSPPHDRKHRISMFCTPPVHFFSQNNADERIPGVAATDHCV